MIKRKFSLFTLSSYIKKTKQAVTVVNQFLQGIPNQPDYALTFSVLAIGMFFLFPS